MEEKEIVMVNVYVAVMDYGDATLKMYTLLMDEHYTTNDIEDWLNANTDYNDSECYYMCSNSPINVVCK